MRNEKWRTKDARRGFTLLETLLAVAILGIGLTVVLQSYGRSLDSLGMSAQYTQALMLLERKLDELEIQGAIAPGSTSGKFEGDPSTRAGRPFGWSVLAIERPGTGLCETRVTVSWSVREREREVSVVTLLRRQ